MNFEPVAHAPLAIQIHLATVIPAFFLGGWLIFVSKKGNPAHRGLGLVYVILMTVTAITAIFIQSLRPGHWSWIHIFVPITLWGMGAALWHAHRGNAQRHRSAMLGVYFGGLVIAGALTSYRAGSCTGSFSGNRPSTGSPRVRPIQAVLRALLTRSKVVSKASGSTRVSPTVVRKLVSPPQRGSACR